MGGPGTKAHHSSTVMLLDVPFGPLSLEGLLTWIDSCVKNRCGGYVCAVNASSLVMTDHPLTSGGPSILS
jgi:hypothetical protein